MVMPVRSAACTRRAFLAALAVASTRRVSAAAMNDTVFELRDYTLHSGQREILIELFEREFVESQEALGANVVGTYRNLDAPDHFVWLRSFAEMETRLRALTAFYSGPVWRAHRDVANATMIDSNNVHLLGPIGGAPPTPQRRLAVGSRERHGSMFVVDVYQQASETAAAFHAKAARDRQVIATFATLRTPNDFPALPVRDDVVFVALRRFDSVAAHLPIANLPAPAETLRLQPTARSLLR